MTTWNLCQNSLIQHHKVMSTKYPGIICFADHQSSKTLEKKKDWSNFSSQSAVIKSVFWFSPIEVLYQISEEEVFFNKSNVARTGEICLQGKKLLSLEDIEISENKIILFTEILLGS